MRSIRLRTTVALAAAAVTIPVALSGCGADDITVDADASHWERLASQPIVSMDRTNATYITGGWISVDSEQKVDYTYARKTDDGGVREETLSTAFSYAYEKVNGFGGGEEHYYPGSEVVTIYEDAKPDGSDARIDYYSCDPDIPEQQHPNSLFGAFDDISCTTPAGEVIDRHDPIVAVHVPEGTVIDEFADKGRSGRGE